MINSLKWLCKNSYIFASLLYVAVTQNSHAAMSVYPMEIAVGQSGASQVKVFSQSDDVQFVKVILKKIIEPGTRREREVIADMSEMKGIVVTPQKIALTAGGERVVRLVSLSPPAKETTWRAYFEGANEDIFSMTSDGTRKNSRAQVGVNIIWGVLVHVAPQQAIASLKYYSNSSRIVNDGTTRIIMKEVGECDSHDICQWKKQTSKVYPDTEIDLSGYKFISGKNYKIKYFDWINQKTEEKSLPAMQAH